MSNPFINNETEIVVLGRQDLKQEICQYLY